MPGRPRHLVMHLVLLVLVVALIMLPAVPRRQAWVSLDGGGKGRAPVIRLVEQDARSVVVEIRLPGCEIQPTDIDGISYSLISVPGAPPTLERGAPELPLLACTLAIPGEGSPRLEILDREFRVLEIPPPVPSRGPLTRQIDPRLVKRIQGPAYAAGEVWPAAVARLGSPFVLHDRRGVVLRLAPLCWDAGRGRLVATSRLVVRITTDGVGGKNALTGEKAGARAVDAVFAAVHERIFLNPPPLAKVGRADLPPRMLMVCGDGLALAAGDLADWKRQRGIQVDLVTLSDLGGDVLGLRQAIYSRYREASGLAYVVLVGDVAQVPTLQGEIQGADSDGLFALIQGDDLYADLLISRLPARNPDEVRIQSAKLLGLERDVQTGDAWLARAAGIASNEGDPPDTERCDLLRDQLLNYGFTDVARVYQGEGGTTAGITGAVEEGVSLVNYLGHGAVDAWLSVPFDTADVHALANTSAWPWVIDVSCHTGDFSQPECLAEAWLRAGTPSAPAGALGVVAASTVAPWVPPCVMQAEMVDRLVSGDTVELGSLFLAGIARVLEVYDGFTVAQQIMEQYNLLGDTSLQVRSRPPTSLTVDHDPTIPIDPDPWTVTVGGPENTVVTLAREGALLAYGRADDTGQTVLNWLPDRQPTAGEELTLTATAVDAVPFTATVTVEGGVTDRPDFPPARTALTGNFPNPCNPATTVRFDLARAATVQLKLYDVRGRQVRSLVGETLPAGPHEVHWDGTDHTGRPVASGVYHARLLAGTVADTRSLVLVR